MAKDVPAEHRRLRELYETAGVNPAEVATYGGQEASLIGQYLDSKALLRSNMAEQRRATRRTVRDIRRQGRIDFSTAIGSALDRGVLGSSGDVSTRAQVKASTASGVLSAREALAQAAAQIDAQRIQARRELFAGLSNVAAQRQAAKALGGINAYAEGLYDRAAGGGGGGPVGVPPSRRIEKAVESADTFPQLLKNLEAIGFRIGETGVKGFGGVGPGHAAGGAHYQRPKRVADINFGPSGASPIERKKIAQLMTALEAAGIPIRQMLGPGDPGHADHLHLEVLVRKWLEKQSRSGGKALRL